MKVILCYDMPKRDKSNTRPRLDKQIEFLLHYLPFAGHSPVALGFVGSPEKYAQTVRALNPDLLWNLFDSFQGVESLSYMGALLLDDIAIQESSKPSSLIVGSPTQTLLFTANKPVLLALLKEAGIAALGCVSLGDPAERLPGKRWLLRPLSGNGKELAIEASSAEDLQRAILLQFLQGEYYAEQHIEGRQFYAAMLGKSDIRPVAIGEIMPNKTVAFRIQDKALLAKMQDAAIKCARLFQLDGFGAISFVLEGSEPYISKVDARPMLTERSLFTQACASAGIAPAHMMATIIAARGRVNER
ncbi:MAG: hypothetical protein LBV04_10045 [Deferribacteraceae bacterium]|jgi:hypothetical protein|nr:hypothetical protein [Deferribacteraceae bacterium]